MYEQFGAIVDPENRSVSFKLFIPDNRKAPEKSAGGETSHITKVAVVGTFQKPVKSQWDTSQAVPLESSDYLDARTGQILGTLYSATVEGLKDGYYEYKYHVEYENESPRMLTDPCARYGGTKHQNSGFVVGELLEEVEPLKQRLPLKDLVIYELMIDDFTANILQDGEAPMQAVVRKLDELQELGINAIEFMPWTAWANKTEGKQHESSNFSWGYDPVQYFAVAHKYVSNRKNESEKLVHLKRLINECHRRGIHVIMDAVFNHADVSTPGKGFPYYWLYENPDNSPYVGQFELHNYFEDLDYANRCTLEYIRDSCFYWMDEFKIDGIRFDNTIGFYKQGDKEVGLNKLLAELREHLSATGQQNFSMTLEHSWDFEAIPAANEAGADSCWLDPYRSQSMNYLGQRPHGQPQIEPGILRILDAGRDFDEGRVPTIYIENHDHRRIARVAGGRECWALTQPYVIALFTSPGAVLMYNGQEWGIDNDMPEEGEGRVTPRPLDWDIREEGDGPRILDLYRRLIQLRHQHPALRSTNFHPSRWDESHTKPDEDGFGIDRDRNLVTYHRWGTDSKGKEEKIYVVLNFSKDPQSVSFEVPQNGFWTELLSGERVRAKGGRIEAEIGSNWGAIYQRVF
ncbi:DUF3459 domain-containing protein [bacterium]|nr:MAG: DUF3459 domain-containing protein [bacterium]